MTQDEEMVLNAYRNYASDYEQAVLYAFAKSITERANLLKRTEKKEVHHDTRKSV